MLEDGDDDLALGDVGHEPPPPATRAGQHVLEVHPAEQARPVDARTETPVPRLVRGLFCAAGALASDGGASGVPSRSTITGTAAPASGFVGLLFGGFGDDLVALAAGTRASAPPHDCLALHRLPALLAVHDEGERAFAGALRRLAPPRRRGAERAERRRG